MFKKIILYLVLTLSILSSVVVGQTKVQAETQTNLSCNTEYTNAAPYPGKISGAIAILQKCLVKNQCLVLSPNDSYGRFGAKTQGAVNQCNSTKEAISNPCKANDKHYLILANTQTKSITSCNYTRVLSSKLNIKALGTSWNSTPKGYFGITRMPSNHIMKQGLPKCVLTTHSIYFGFEGHAFHDIIGRANKNLDDSCQKFDNTTLGMYTNGCIGVGTDTVSTLIREARNNYNTNSPYRFGYVQVI